LTSLHPNCGSYPSKHDGNSEETVVEPVHFQAFTLLYGSCFGTPATQLCVVLCVGLAKQSRIKLKVKEEELGKGHQAGESRVIERYCEVRVAEGNSL
jgi:hypothetical protein